MSQDPGTGGGAANSPLFPPMDNPEIGAASETADMPRELAPPNRATSVAGRFSEEIMRRVESGIQRGLGHFADQLESTAAQIDDLAGDHLATLGPRGEQAADAAASLSGRINDFSDYLRNSELDGLQRDLADHFRAEPLRTLALSLGTGWVLGKILRK